MIETYIHDICDILKIKAPRISYDTSHFQTKTMMAQTYGDTLYIKKYDNVNPDQLFAIAHELRHMWQIKTDRVLYFSTYNPPENCSSVEEYNLQTAELDANAFAGLVMMEFFHLKPLFKGVPETVKDKIYERIEYLRKEENFYDRL